MLNLFGLSNNCNFWPYKSMKVWLSKNMKITEYGEKAAHCLKGPFIQEFWPDSPSNFTWATANINFLTVSQAPQDHVYLISHQRSTTKVSNVRPTVQSNQLNQFFFEFRMIMPRRVLAVLGIASERYH